MTMAASIESTPSLTPSPSRSPSPSLPVQPDHFYSPDGDARPAPPSLGSTGHAWLSPDSDPLAARGIPVFKPTMEEFRDFEVYMNRVEPWGMHSGIVKIIPPEEWTNSLPSTVPQLANVRINSPIEQHMLGHAGIFRQQNIVRRKAVSIREWAELCAKEDYRAPAVDEVGLKAAGEHTPRVKRKNKRRGTTAAKENEPLVKEEMENEVRLEGSARMHDTATPLPVAEVGSDAELGDDEHAASSRIPPPQAPSPSPSPRKRHFPTREEREAAAARRAELDAAFLETFDPHTAWLPRNTSASDYNPSFCSTLERRYWRNCGIGKPAWYGADTPGTLFTDETTVWNVGSLPSTLSRLLPKNRSGLPGVNTPYLYFGMWRATFAWHVEDMDLFSINYIHWGAPKFWYAVPQMRAMQLENTLRSFFPRDGEKCRQFLRHKSFFASPTLLAQSGCKPNTVVQHAGEFVITYPRGYHAGFNLGFNCAESVNFALDSWLDIGRKAQACGCVGDSVRIDVDALLRAREEEELVAEETVQPKPSSKKPSSKCEDSKKTKSPRKRKSDGSNDPKAKKRKVNPETSEVEVTEDGVLSSPSASGSKQTIMLRLPKDPGPYPCCLCISRNTDGLLRVHDCPNPWSGCQNVPPKDASGNEVWRAHESCAMVVPETWVDEEANEEGQVEKVVFGVDTIVKDRWALKCSLCQKSRARAHGAPIQCTKGRCPKAFHVSCVREGGQENRIQFMELREVEKEVVLNDFLPSAESLPLPEPSEEGNAILEPIGFGDNASIDPSLLSIPPPSTSLPGDSAPSHEQAVPSSNVVKTIKKIEYELLCTQHNPVVMAARRASKVDRVRNELLSLPAMSRIKLRVSAGVFEVSLLSVNEERNTVEVIWDDGIRKEFKWGSLVRGKAEGQTVGQKPTVPAPPKEPASEQTQINPNVPFNPFRHATLSHSTTPSTDTQLSIPVMTQTHYPAHTYFNSGKFNYNAWWNAFYAYAPSMPTSSTTSNSLRDAQTCPQYGDAASYQPPMASLTWSAPTAPHHDQQGYVTGTFSPAFHQAVASSVATLPPRSQTFGQSASSGPPGQEQGPSSHRDIGSSEQTAPLPTSAGTEAGSSIPPEVVAAVEELQRLSSLDTEQLKEVLESKPALREAIKILVERQSTKAQAQTQIPAEVFAPAT